MFRAREGSVDLVADDRDIVGVRQLHHPGEFLGGVHHPRRIVWGAQQVGGGMFLLERDLQGVEIEASRLGGGGLDDAASCLVADRPERRVDRRVDDDGVAGFRGRQGHFPHARHDVAGQRHRRRSDVPAPDIGGEGRERLLIVGQLRVAGVTLGDHSREDIHHRRHRLGVHLRDEQRQHVGREPGPFDAAPPAEVLKGDVEDGHGSILEAPRSGAPEAVSTGCSFLMSRLNRRWGRDTVTC